MEALSIILLVFGILMMTSGLHSIDNAWNMAYIEHEANMHLQDCSMLGCGPKENIYNNGVAFVMLSLILYIFSMLVLYIEPKK